ncbi:hypothetical protein GGP53_003136 [Salinibacter ruber]|uniref:hypothetical protein n=1 Tax=Salinibacter ruber TaxID=146919 RepID=UPI00216A7593|nr:hypothetical protein [Salinibacter ruber]MCS3629256.1 hypothetical protein [Salinibacter ruber]MCS4146164.1 hypothetical protein [Salinibacter ruber]
MIRYDKVTVHFQGETSPMVVRGVAELAKSRFPGSGDPALQIIKAPSSPEGGPGGSPGGGSGGGSEGGSKGNSGRDSGGDSGQVFAGGLFNLELNLARPSEIDYLVLQEGEERREAEVEDLFEEWDWRSS